MPRHGTRNTCSARGSRGVQIPLPPSLPPTDVSISTFPPRPPRRRALIGVALIEVMQMGELAKFLTAPGETPAARPGCSDIEIAGYRNAAAAADDDDDEMLLMNTGG